LYESAKSSDLDWAALADRAETLAEALSKAAQAVAEAAQLPLRGDSDIFVTGDVVRAATDDAGNFAPIFRGAAGLFSRTSTMQTGRRDGAFEVCK